MGAFEDGRVSVPHFGPCPWKRLCSSQAPLLVASDAWSAPQGQMYLTEKVAYRTYSAINLSTYGNMVFHGHPMRAVPLLLCMFCCVLRDSEVFGRGASFWPFWPCSLWGVREQSHATGCSARGKCAIYTQYERLNENHGSNIDKSQTDLLHFVDDSGYIRPDVPMEVAHNS